MANVRIIEQPEITTLSGGEFLVTDSQTAGTKKITPANLVAAAGGGGSGLTEEVKQALLQIAEKVAYIDDQGQTYYDALEDALYPPANLVSISAVYTQSGTVYDTDTLDSLKADLVVTAHYDNSTSQTVTAYTLSGTLAEGTSTITVSYGGKTATFNVTVTQTNKWLYHFNDSLTSSGNKDFGLSATTPNYVEGHFDNAVKIQSLDNIPYTIGVSSNELPVFDGDFTVSVWANATANATSTIFRMAERQGTSTIGNYLKDNPPTFYNGYNYQTDTTRTGTLQRTYVGYSLSLTRPSGISTFCAFFTIYSGDTGQTKRMTLDLYNSAYPINVNEWHHYAMTRKDGAIMFFIDGLKAASINYSDPLYVPSVANIGGAWSNATTPSYQSGSAPIIDEFYINDSVCLYDSDFTVPNTPYSA